MNPALPQPILWRRADRPGHEACRIVFQDPRWIITGAAVFLHDHMPCLLEYRIECDAGWQTIKAEVTGWVGDEGISVAISVDERRIWTLNGVERPEVAGCIDLDLNFSPSTNTLPVRRLDLQVGQLAEVRAAWLRFPGFHLEPLSQIYRRLDDATYRYESAGGAFARDITVNSTGLVTEYPGVWTSVA